MSPIALSEWKPYITCARETRTDARVINCWAPPNQSRPKGNAEKKGVACLRARAHLGSVRVLVRVDPVRTSRVRRAPVGQVVPLVVYPNVEPITANLACNRLHLRRRSDGADRWTGHVSRPRQPRGQHGQVDQTRSEAQHHVHCGKDAGGGDLKALPAFSSRISERIADSLISRESWVHTLARLVVQPTLAPVPGTVAMVHFLKRPREALRSTKLLGTQRKWPSARSDWRRSTRCSWLTRRRSHLGPSWLLHYR